MSFTAPAAIIAALAASMAPRWFEKGNRMVSDAATSRIAVTGFIVVEEAIQRVSTSLPVATPTSVRTPATSAIAAATP